MKHTLRLHKRFGSDTSFDAANIAEGVERLQNYFGEGTAQDDDHALQSMSRTALSQYGNETKKKRGENEDLNFSETKRSLRVEDFDAVGEELFLASALYTTEGLKVTEVKGPEAVERARAALRPHRRASVLQRENGTDDTEGLGDRSHKLFQLGTPGESLVGFTVEGQLNKAMMQL